MSPAQKGNHRILSREIRILRWQESRGIALSIILTLLMLGPGHDTLSLFSFLSSVWCDRPPLEINLINGFPRG